MNQMLRILHFFLIAAIAYVITLPSEISGYVPPLPRPPVIIHTSPKPSPRPTSGSVNESECKKHTVRVAVIDTGLGYMGNGITSHVCKYGHKDFTQQNVYTDKFETEDPMPYDFVGHGTNIVGLIDKYAAYSGVDYCVVVLKFFDEYSQRDENVKAEIEAIRYADKLHVDIINLSEGGLLRDKDETSAVKKYLDNGGTIIAAAGNESDSLGKRPYYLAMYNPRIVVVGSINEDGNRSIFSNYGERVDIWEVGVQATGNGITFSGTSQAAGITTGKVVAHMKELCYK